MDGEIDMKKQSVLCKIYERMLERLEKAVDDSLLLDPNSEETIVMDRYTMVALAAKVRSLREQKKNKKLRLTKKRFVK